MVKTSRSPKGTEITAYINGDTHLDEAKFQVVKTGTAAASGVTASVASTAQLDITSTPSGAEIEIDGKFVGGTPSSLSIVPGDYDIVVKKAGFSSWEKKISVSAGHINISADLVAETK
jgi:hypothetical protein